MPKVASSVRCSACPGLHRQRLLGPIQRFNIGLFVETEHDRVLRQRHVLKPMTSVTLASNSQMVENLKISAFHSFTPYRFSTPCDRSHRLVSSRPASSRDDQMR